MNLRSGALASYGERATQGALDRYSVGKPYRVFKDTSVRQVIRAEKFELSSGEWDYYTRAAFDFLVCNKDEDSSYEIVIEFDGSFHSTQEQALKDSLKNKICVKAGLPIVRIGTEEILIRANMTFLQYILDLYFGEKEMNSLKGRGVIAEDEDFFVGYGFPGTEVIVKRLMSQHGIAPAGLAAILAGTQSIEHIRWYRVLAQNLNTKRVEVIEGWKVPRTIASVERSATVTVVNPESNVPGIHIWHIASELAEFLCMEALERDLNNKERKAA